MARLIKLTEIVVVFLVLISYVELKDNADTNEANKDSLSVINSNLNNKPIISAKNVSNSQSEGSNSTIITASTINLTSSSEKPESSSTTTQSSVNSTTVPQTNSTSEPTDDGVTMLDGINVDEMDEKTNQTLIQHNITKFEQDYHEYYNSTMFVDSNSTNLHRTSIFADCANMTISNLLSKSHRRAMTVKLPFDFPFYGHPIRNITIATGGFLYAGDYIHSWLAATQYIAPLMANFDTSISNDSYVKYCENENSFHVYWERIHLQSRSELGPFTFSASLYSNGNVVFAYYSLPIEIEKIEDDKHPVKVGVSDAYIIDKTIYHARRKTIYEYHRVNFESVDIKNFTTIKLTALPTCLYYSDCDSCMQNTSAFKCFWCPSLKRCSSGLDRKRQEWTTHGCEKSQISNRNQCVLTPDNFSPTPPLSPVSTESSSITYDTEHSHYISKKEPIVVPNPNVGLVTGLCTVVGLMFAVLLWAVYAYRNPHTKSGQLLIQYRPSVWSWRRGEARYTAATIHM